MLICACIVRPCGMVTFAILRPLVPGLRNLARRIVSSLPAAKSALQIIVLIAVNCYWFSHIMEQKAIPLCKLFAFSFFALKLNRTEIPVLEKTIRVNK